MRITRTHAARRRGFTLIELIILLLVGAAMAAMVVTLSYDLSPKFGNETVIHVDRHHSLLREAERMQAAYRRGLQNDNLNLQSLLNNWNTLSTDVSVTVSRVPVSDTSGSFTFSTTVYKVRLTNGDMSMDTYFAE